MTPEKKEFERRVALAAAKNIARGALGVGAAALTIWLSLTIPLLFVPLFVLCATIYVAVVYAIDEVTAQIDDDRRGNRP